MSKSTFSKAISEDLYHLGFELKVSKCRASDFCSFGDSDLHYKTKEDAETARVVAMRVQKLKKRSSKWVNSLSFYSVSPQGPDGNVARQYADSYYSQDRENHREHLSKFSDRLEEGCLYCGSKKNLSLSEHIIAVTKGGITVVGNLIVVCRDCNGKKGNLDAEVFFKKRLEDPDFSHPIFKRSMEAFLAFIDDYTEPFRREYPQEWKRAIEINKGNAEKLKEFIELACWHRIETVHGHLSYAIKAELVKDMVEFRKNCNQDGTSEDRRATDTHPYWVSIREITAGNLQSTNHGIYSAAERIFSSYEKLGRSEALMRWRNESARAQGGNGSNLRRCLKILIETTK